MRDHNPAFSGVEDDALVCLAQDGRSDAFAELIERYLPTCMRLAMSILRDRQNAEDEVQNTSWKAFEHIGQFSRDAKFSTWLSRIVVNQCLMRLRKDRSVRFLYLDDGVQAEEAVTLDLPDRTLTPESALAQSEIGQILEREVRRIPPVLREVFILRYVRELPLRDVARHLGISVAAAKSRLLRARLELRGRLSKHTGRLGLATLTA